ncbi:hypothetical protein V1521DRAFT_449774 [Lipomyces starkeyi]
MKDCRRNKEENRRDNNQNGNRATTQKSGNNDHQRPPKERNLALTERMALTATNTNSAIKPGQWYLDSGASYHYCNDITQMFDLRKDNRVVEVANGAEVEIEGIGSVRIALTNAEGETAPFTLQEVRYSPKFSMSLLSIGRATDTCNDEIEIAFRKQDAYLRIEGTGEELHIGRKEADMRLYEFSEASFNATKWCLMPEKTS